MDSSENDVKPSPEDHLDSSTEATNSFFPYHDEVLSRNPVLLQQVLDLMQTYLTSDFAVTMSYPEQQGKEKLERLLITRSENGQAIFAIAAETTPTQEDEPGIAYINWIDSENRSRGRLMLPSGKKILHTASVADSLPEEQFNKSLQGWNEGKYMGSYAIENSRAMKAEEISAVLEKLKTSKIDPELTRKTISHSTRQYQAVEVPPKGPMGISRAFPSGPKFKV